MGSPHPFLSVENVQDLVAVFSQFLYTKQQWAKADIAALKLRRVFLEAMEQISQESVHKNKTTDELNRMTMMAVKEYVLREKATPKSNPRKDPLDIAPRPQDTSGRRPLRDSTLAATPSIQSTLGAEQAEKALESLMQARHATVPEDVPAHVKEGIRVEPMIEALSLEDMNRTVEALQQARSTMDAEWGDSSKPPPRSADGKIAKTVETFSEDLKDPPALHARIFDSTPFQGNQVEADPHDAYRQNFQRNDILEADYEKGRSLNHDLPQSFIADAPKKFRLRERYLVLDTTDRDWISYPSRNKFQINFQYTQEEVRKVPFYANNPTIPFTKSSTSSGIPNKTGWYDANGSFRAAYDSAQPKGDVVGFEELTFLTDKSANLNTEIQNIRWIQVKSVIIPTTVLRNATQSAGVHGFNINFPYILLHLDQFSNVMDGTNDTLRRSFCQLVYRDHYYTPNGRGYIKLLPMQQERKEFYPTPLSMLSSLNVSLRKPNGELLTEGVDGLAIHKIHFEPFNPCYLQVVTNTYFQKDDFFQGDLVRIKNFMLFKYTDTAVDSVIQRVNDWVNREAGHEVTQLGEANEAGYYKTFSIKAPGVFDAVAGAFQVDQDMLTQINLFHDNYVCSHTLEENGRILNMSLQNTISLTIACEDYDAYPVGPDGDRPSALTRI